MYPALGLSPHLRDENGFILEQGPVVVNPALGDVENRDGHRTIGTPLGQMMPRQGYLAERAKQRELVGCKLPVEVQYPFDLVHRTYDLSGCPLEEQGRQGATWPSQPVDILSSSACLMPECNKP